MSRTPQELSSIQVILFLGALLVSLVLHVLMAMGFAHGLVSASSPDVPVQLDVSSVELSIAETPDDTAAVTPATSPMPRTETPKPSETKTELLPPDPIERATPPETQPDTFDLPKPDESLEQLVTPAPQPPSPAVAPRQAKVDAPPNPRRTIKPDYPRESRLRGEQGNVTLEIDVNAQGAVDGVRVVASTGFMLLDEAAIRAVRAARFSPAQSDGKPVPSTARLTLNFKLK